ncbi:MAG: S41 family peptidase [Chloroflexi bacterium]|nr:S41 family peptidase [Chloroflexota bacterium]
MKRTKLLPLILTLLFIAGLISTAAVIASEMKAANLYPALDVQQSVSAGIKKEKSEKDKAVEIKLYEPLLKGEKKLEYIPDQRLLDVIYAILKSRFVSEIDDNKYYGAMKTEVKKLLKQAGVDPGKLNLMPADESFPARAVIVYGKAVPEDLIYYACIQAIPDGLGDEHTRLMEPSEYLALRELLDVKGFGGVGMSIDLTKEEKQLFAVEVFEGTPAEKAGVKNGDWIMAIDGKSTKGITVRGAQDVIRGKPGTKVTLTIKREGEKNLLTLTPIRDHVVIHAIKPPEILNNDIGYIKMRFFSNDTAGELKDAIKELRSKGAKALILDVRNNGGGYLNTAVDVSSLFLPDNASVVKIRDRNGDASEYSSNGKGAFDLPMVLLINRYSASASEILAGCLKDNKIAILIGEKTYGKGSVQTIMEMDGPVLKVTIQKFYTPNDNVIDKVGVSPDIKIDLTPDKVSKPDDAQIKKAIEVLEQKLTTN